MQQDKNKVTARKSPPDNVKKGNTKANALAHEQAENDIEQDADLNSKPAAEDGLDEGELARLEGED